MTDCCTLGQWCSLPNLDSITTRRRAFSENGSVRLQVRFSAVIYRLAAFRAQALIARVLFPPIGDKKIAQPWLDCELASPMGQTISGGNS
jgi:hypothetical protein